MQKKHLYAIGLMIVLAFGAIIVTGYNTGYSPSFAGHSLEEVGLNVTCGGGQRLTSNGTDITCANVATSDTRCDNVFCGTISGSGLNVARTSGGSGARIASVSSTTSGNGGRGVYVYPQDSSGYFKVAGEFNAGANINQLSLPNSQRVGVAGLVSDHDFFLTGGDAYGVYGMVQHRIGGATGSAGVYGNGGFYTGVIGNGDICDFDAVGSGTDYCSTSSIRWKENISQIPEALDKVLGLRGVYFNWDEAHGGAHGMGMIAEEVGLVVPEIVAWQEGEEYANGLDYGALTPLLVEAIKEQQAQIEQLQQIVCIDHPEAEFC